MGTHSTGVVVDSEDVEGQARCFPLFALAVSTNTAVARSAWSMRSAMISCSGYFLLAVGVSLARISSVVGILIVIGKVLVMITIRYRATLSLIDAFLCIM